MQKVGIIKKKKSGLTLKHLRAVGADKTPVCIVGMDDEQEFREVILEGKRNALDFGRFETELLGVAATLVNENPDVGAIVLECTDMPYFAHLIQQKVNLPVFDLTTLTMMVQQAVVRQAYQGIMPR